MQFRTRKVGHTVALIISSIQGERCTHSHLLTWLVQNPHIRKQKKTIKKCNENEETQQKKNIFAMPGQNPKIRAGAWPEKRPNFFSEGWAEVRDAKSRKKTSSRNDTCGKRCKVNDQKQKVISYWGQGPAGQTSGLCCQSLGRGEGQ